MFEVIAFRISVRYQARSSLVKYVVIVSATFGRVSFTAVCLFVCLFVCCSCGWISMKFGGTGGEELIKFWT